MHTHVNITATQTFVTELGVKFQQVTTPSHHGDIETGVIDIQGVRDPADQIQGRLGNVIVIDPRSRIGIL